MRNEVVRINSDYTGDTEYEKSINTLYINEMIPHCENSYDFAMKVMPLVKQQGEMWAREIADIMDKVIYSATDICRLCNVHADRIYDWLKGQLPRNREIYRRIGMLAGFSVERMNFFLTRFAREYELYTKDIDDCICRFVIEKNYSSGEETIAAYDELRKRFNKSENKKPENVTTIVLERKLQEVTDFDEFDVFINENKDIFNTSHRRICASVKVIVEEWYREKLIQRYGQSNKVLTKKITANEIVTSEAWKPGLRNQLFKIYNGSWNPSRKTIILLGFYLNMDKDQINDLLADANMLPLYAKNYFESVLIYILDAAGRDNIFNQAETDYGSEDLVEYALGQLDDILAEISAQNSGLSITTDVVMLQNLMDELDNGTYDR